MTEAAEENSLDEFKEKVNEVVELLNQPNLPVAVNEDGAPELGLWEESPK